MSEINPNNIWDENADAISIVAAPATEGGSESIYQFADSEARDEIRKIYNANSKIKNYNENGSYAENDLAIKDDGIYWFSGNQWVLVAAKPTAVDADGPALPALEGTVDLEAGAEYKITAPITLSNSVKINGHGAKLKVIHVGNAIAGERDYIPIFYIPSETNSVTIQDVILDGNNQVNCSLLINSNNVTINNVTIQGTVPSGANAPIDIYQKAGENNVFSNIQMINSLVIDQQAVAPTGINLTGSLNRITECKLTNYATGIKINSANNYFSDITFKNCTKCYDASASATIKNNCIDECGTTLFDLTKLQTSDYMLINGLTILNANTGTVVFQVKTTDKTSNAVRCTDLLYAGNTEIKLFNDIENDGERTSSIDWSIYNILNQTIVKNIPKYALNYEILTNIPDLYSFTYGLQAITDNEGNSQYGWEPIAPILPAYPKNDLGAASTDNTSNNLSEELYLLSVAYQRKTVKRTDGTTVDQIAPISSKWLPVDPLPDSRASGDMYTLAAEVTSDDQIRYGWQKITKNSETYDTNQWTQTPKTTPIKSKNANQNTYTAQVTNYSKQIDAKIKESQNASDNATQVMDDLINSILGKSSQATTVILNSVQS